MHTHMETITHTHMARLASGLSLAVFFLSCTSAAVHAQLPKPSRTVYKCEVKGKISYSDEPCVGAQRLDVVPTRGVNRLSGTARTGQDVANEIRSEHFAGAIQPLTGKTPAQFATAARRHHLGVETQRECALLETAILESEQVERRARTTMMESVQQDLFILRKRYKKLGC